MFYERLNQLCKQHGTSVTEVATSCLGVASSAATNWKRGASPRSDIVIRAAQHFGVTTDYLLGLADSPAPQPNPSAADPLQDALALLRTASDAAQAASLAAIQAIVAALDGNRTD